MKKVIIFKEYLLGASERFVLDQAKNISKFYVVLMGLNKLKFFDLNDIRWECLDLYSKLQVILYKLFGFCPKLVSLIKKEHSNLIHVHMGGDATRFVKIRNKFKIPVIATFHGFDATVTDEWKRKSKNLYLRQYLKQRSKLIETFSHFIAVSNFVKEKMILQGFPENKITVHYIGLDTIFFKCDKNIKRERIVLFVGRLIKRKGCDILIKAVRNIPDMKLLVIGDGPELENLKKISLLYGNKTSFLGILNKFEIKKYLNQVSIFCGPSITAESGEEEGLGIVFLEAQSMGVPVVSFFSGGISEAVEHNKTGFLYQEHDEQGITEGITKLLNDQNLWNEFSENAIKHVNDKFDIKNQTIKLEQIYEKVINDWKN